MSDYLHRKDLFSLLPNEIVILILGYINFEDNMWSNVRRVCKRFEELSWKAFDHSFDENWPIRSASSRGNIKLVRKLLSTPARGIDPSAENNYAIQVACIHGHLEVVRELLKDPRVDPTVDKSYCFRTACKRGYIGIVELLLEDSRIDPNIFDNNIVRNIIEYHSETKEPDLVSILDLFTRYPTVDLSFNRNFPIRFSSELGHDKIVSILMKDPRVDPSDEDNYCIRLASRGGHVEVVRLLLKDPRVDPSAMNNYAIRYASKKGCTLVVEELLKDDRVDPTDVDNEAIRNAIFFNHADVINLLIRYNKVTQIQVAFAIRVATACGYPKIVLELIREPNIDLSMDDNHLIKWATLHKHMELIDILLNDPQERVDPFYGGSKSAFQLAITNGHYEIINRMLAHKAKKEIVNLVDD